MDLIGEFYPKSLVGNCYALTNICMLTGFTFCTHLKSKSACKVVQTYVDSIHATFGGSNSNLSDKGSEFKNSLFEEVAKQLGYEYKVYTSPYHPQSKGRFEGFHHFLRTCISNHVSGTLEWH